MYVSISIPISIRIKVPVLKIFYLKIISPIYFCVSLLYRIHSMNMKRLLRVFNHPLLDIGLCINEGLATISRD